MKPATETTQNPHSVTKPARTGWRRLSWFLLALIVLLLCLLRWGGYLLISDDPLPARVDTAVVLQGSIAGEQARIEGAMQLLRQGTADRLLLSIPRQSYWGEELPPIVRQYVARNYGDELAGRVDFCLTGPEVDSTEQEARVVMDCVHKQGWSLIAVVTSNYHTRRASLLWRKVLQEERSPVHLWVHAVPDPEFQPQGWWRKRRYAKTWVMESAKLAWTILVEA